MKVVATQYVDIIFCDESLHTAQLVIENVDNLFEQAFLELGAKQKIRFPIVISPDSDNLVISYSPIPYNRIIIFDAVPTAEMACYENTILSLLYHEITKAVNYSVTFKFAQVIKNIFRVDSLQPIPLLNIPFSIVEGWSFIEESKDGNGRMNDFFFLEQLSVAKFENKFPNWMQVSVKKELKRENDLSYAAGAAFIAFIQQRWGMEKFLEFWNESGNINFFRLMAGNFKKVYGVSLSSAWKDFVEVIPLPSDIEQIIELEKYTSKLIKNDTEGAVKNIINTPYGLVWYDDIRHEVDILDLNSEVKTRKLLFLASDITRLSLSPDGRFLAVSFTELGSREQFKNDVTWIFDLEERRFLSESYRLRESSIIQLQDNTYAIAGVDTSKKYPIIKVYTIPEIYDVLDIESADESSKIVYSKSLNYNSIPTSITFVKNGIFQCLVNNQNRWFLLRVDINSKEEKTFTLLDGNNIPLSIRNLNLLNKETKSYSFMYMEKGDVSFVKMGILTLDEDYYPKELLLQSNNLSGGVNYPTVKDDVLFYSANRYNFNELVCVDINLLDFNKGNVQEDFFDLDLKQSDLPFNYKTKMYLAFPYWFNGLIVPMLPVWNLSLTEGTKMWPGLGLTYITSIDPLQNTDFVVSAGFGFAKLNFELLTDPTVKKLETFIDGMTDFSDNWSAAGFIKNTSTPVDISLGTILLYNHKIGTYKWDSIATTKWDIPLGMSFRKLSMDIQSRFSFSTDYYDVNKIEEKPSLSNWPTLNQAYKSFLLQSNAVYSNIHQHGVSAFEKRGISISTSIIGFWDIDKTLSVINENIKKRELLSTNSQNQNTNQDVSSNGSVFSDFFGSVETFTFGFSIDIEVPRLTPLKFYKGLVLSVPARFELNFFDKVGSVMEYGVEILPLGIEINRGIPFLNLFFSRVGIFVGYFGNFVYDTNSTNLPNVIYLSTYKDVFANSTYLDYVSLSLSLDFIPVIGKLSENNINVLFDFQFYLQQPSFKFQFKFNFNY